MHIQVYDIFLLIVEEQLLLLHHMKTCSIRLITAESVSDKDNLQCCIRRSAFN